MIEITYSREDVLSVSHKIVSTIKSSSVRCQKNFPLLYQLMTMIIVVSLLLLSSSSSSNTTATQAQPQQRIALMQTTKDDNFLTYENNAYAIRIQYPSNWEKIKFNQRDSSHNIVVIFRSPPENASDTKLENLVIQVGNLPFQNMPLEDVSRANINKLKQSLIDFDLNESTTITVARGNPAHKIVYTDVEENNVQSKTMQVLTIKSDKVYLITYTAEQRKYDSYLPTIQKMIDSFRIKTLTDDAFHA